MTTSELLVPIFGGIGNQMFQVAHALAVSENYDLQPTFVQMTNRGTSVRNWEVEVFGIRRGNISPIRVSILRLRISAAREIQKITKKSFMGVAFDNGKEVAKYAATPPRVLYGYWQRKAFFESYETSVRRQFRFPDLDKDPVAVAINNKPRSVAIHIRRGDYVSDPVARAHHLICDADWYETSWEFLRLRLGDCHAFVFSDDPAWVRSNLSLEGSITIVEKVQDEEPWKDMARMSLCDSFIISNSSYSWWAAYLSKSDNKTVVAPKFWFNGISTSEIEICPNDWMLR